MPAARCACPAGAFSTSLNDIGIQTAAQEHAFRHFPKAAVRILWSPISKRYQPVAKQQTLNVATESFDFENLKTRPERAPQSSLSSAEALSEKNLPVNSGLLGQ